MTTLVYRDGVLASDSGAEINGWRTPSAFQKVWQTKWCLLGVTGDYHVAMAHIPDLLLQGQPMPDYVADLGESARIVAIFKDEAVVFEGKGRFNVSLAPYLAFGSGMPVALGALHAGATAEQAVAAAIAFDTSSCGAIQSVRLA